MINFKCSIFRCFKPEIAGVSKSDVYVVDLVAAEKEINMLDIPIDNDDLNIDAPHLPAVYVSLLPDVVSFIKRFS